MLIKGRPSSRGGYDLGARTCRLDFRTTRYVYVFKPLASWSFNSLCIAGERAFGCASYPKGLENLHPEQVVTAPSPLLRVFCTLSGACTHALLH